MSVHLFSEASLQTILYFSDSQPKVRGFFKKITYKLLESLNILIQWWTYDKTISRGTLRDTFYQGVRQMKKVEKRCTIQCEQFKAGTFQQISVELVTCPNVFNELIPKERLEQNSFES